MHQFHDHLSYPYSTKVDNYVLLLVIAICVIEKYNMRSFQDVYLAPPTYCAFVMHVFLLNFYTASFCVPSGFVYEYFNRNMK